MNPKPIKIVFALASILGSDPLFADAAPATPFLSVFETAGSQTHWLAIGQAGDRQQRLATFEAALAVRNVAWDHHRTHALLWLARARLGSARHRLWVVSLDPGGDAHPPRGLPLPPIGELVDCGYDQQDRLVALTAQAPSPSSDGVTKAQTLVFRGRRYPIVGAPAAPRLVHAFRLEGLYWRLIETTSGGTRERPTETLLQANRLGVRMLAQLHDQAPDTNETGRVADARWLAILGHFRPPLPGDALGYWRRLSDGPFGALAWVDAEASLPPHYTRPLLFFHGPTHRLTNAPGFGYDEERAFDRLWLLRRGRHLLASGDGLRLYDLATRRMLFQSPSDHPATFWPSQAPNTP